MTNILTAKQAFDLVHSPGFSMDTLQGKYISAHFGWAEAFHSRTISEIKGACLEIFNNIQAAASRMEQIRAYLAMKIGKPIEIIVISWWRSLAANLAAGGATHSQHMLGLAVDFVVPGCADAYIQALLMGAKDSIGFCLEITHGHWTHIDLRPAHFAFENLGHGQYKVMSLVECQAFIRKYGQAA